MGHASETPAAPERRLTPAGLARVRHPLTHVSYLTRQLSLPSLALLRHELARFALLLEPVPHVLRLLECSHTPQEGLCSTVHALTLVYEDVEMTLEEDITARASTASHYPLPVLLQLAESLVLALSALHSLKLPHPALSTHTVLLPAHNCFKLLDPVICGHAEVPFTHREIEQAQLEPLKTDVFRLGVLLLRASSLLPSETYFL
jgi:hypothetical protein